MTRGSSETPAVPAAIERFLKQLVVTMKAVTLYPPASSIPHENAVEAAALLGKALQDRAEIRFAVHKEGLFYEANPVFLGQTAFESFSQELYHRGIAEVRFHHGVSGRDILAFLGSMLEPPASIAAAGGIETRLWDLGVDSITVKEASARVVDTVAPSDGEETPDEPWPPDVARIDEIVASALGGRPRDQRLLVRVMTDVDTMSAYLRETMSGRGENPAHVLADLPVGDMARFAMRADKESRTAMFRALAAAIEALDPDLRRMLVAERLLAEARTDDAIASVVRQMDIDNVCKMLVEGLTDDPASIDGLARAIRNLALISLADREEVLGAAGAAMHSAGVPDPTISAVFEAVSPSRLTVRERQHQGAQDAEAAYSILKLVDLAPGSVTHRFDDDAGYVALQEESRRGITDGDVVGALVTIVSVDAQGANFGSMMALVDDNLSLVVERGDYEIAAQAAEALAQTITDEGLDEARRSRLSAALDKLGRREELDSIARAMRVYPPGSPEHLACRRLLEALGESAVEPLLEVLADEPDMAARKALVDLLSGMAPAHIMKLSSHASDPRWYFVRNVIAILGSTKRPAILPALERTLRHPDARVRRETIRALAGVQDRLAAEMLVAALDDADAQNVQLAARYLGSAKVRGAIGALEQVARGEGRGNRDIGPRIEAIEALGRIGARESLATLEALAGKRALLGRSSVRELKAAAEGAIAAIGAAGKGTS